MPSPSVPVLNALRDKLPALSPAQQGVARLILEAPELSLEQSVETLAVRAGVSMPTIVRMCQALGFEGLREFKATLAAELAHAQPTLPGHVGRADPPALVASKVIDGATRALTKLRESLSTTHIDAAAERIARARRVDCYAAGAASSFMANDMQSRLMRLGLASNAYFDAHLQLVSAAMLGASDVVVAFSHVGRMPYLLESIAYAAEQGACVIAITQTGTPLAERAQIALTVDVPEDAVMRVGTEAYLVHLAVIEILMTCVAQRRDEMVRSRMRAIQRLLTERSVDRP